MRKISIRKHYSCNYVSNQKDQMNLTFVNGLNFIVNMTVVCFQERTKAIR
jgi:hypothetical protein